jgi:hypothetical protein
MARRAGTMQAASVTPWKVVSNNNVMRLNENLDSAHIVADSEIIWKRDVKQN